MQPAWMRAFPIVQLRMGMAMILQPQFLVNRRRLESLKLRVGILFN